MNRFLRTWVLPLGLAAGILIPDTADAQPRRKDGDRRDFKERSWRSWDNWHGKRRWRQTCWSPVRRCTRTRVWFDRDGDRHVIRGRCWTEWIPVRC